MGYVVVVPESTDGLSDASVYGEKGPNPFGLKETAEAAAANLRFQGAEGAVVAALEQFTPVFDKRFVVSVTGGGKTVCYGPQRGQTWPSRDLASDAAKRLVPGGGAEPPDQEPVTSTQILEVDQQEAAAWTIEGMPE